MSPYKTVMNFCIFLLHLEAKLVWVSAEKRDATDDSMRTRVLMGSW